MRRDRRGAALATLTIAALAAACAGDGAPSNTAPVREDVELPAGAAGANRAELARFLSGAPHDDGPFYMVNLVAYRDRAQYADGRATTLSGAEADAVYGDWMRTTMLPSIGARIVFGGPVEADLAGGSEFDLVGVVRYPSRAKFAQMLADPAFASMIVHKQAGIASTTVLATERIEMDRIPPPAEPPYPATDGDRPFAFVHIIDYRDRAQYAPGDADADDTRTGRAATTLYTEHAGAVAAPLGVRPLAWFRVVATINGEAGVWEEVRINSFPSHATFSALTADPAWQAGRHHREAGIERTYALQTLPGLDALSGP